MKCTDCGHPLPGHSVAADSLAIGRTPVAGEDAPDNSLRPPQNRQDQFMTDVGRLVETATPIAIVTPVLIGLNVAVFVAMTLGNVSPVNPTVDDLIRWGANYGPSMTHGQWWRPLTGMFMHVGVIHLAMNMYVLWSVGRLTERLFGSVGFGVLYMMTGVAGGLASVWWHPTVAGAGASGAIFGLYGGLFGYLMIRRASVPPQALEMLAKYGAGFVLANIVINLGNEHIDLAAHLGGLLAGVPIGAALALPGTASYATQARRSAIVATAGLALAAGVATRVPVVDDWFAEFGRLAALEGSSQKQFQDGAAKVADKSLAPADFVKMIEGTLLPPWDEERRTIIALRTTGQDHARAEKLAAFMTVRGDAWRLWGQALQKNDTKSMSDALAKDEEALIAMQAAMPTKAIADSIEQMRAKRTAFDAQVRADEAFHAELARFGATESSVIRAFNGAMTQASTGKLSGAQLADVIEAQVLRPWTDERARLLGAAVPSGREAFVARLTQYMTTEAEAFQLYAKGARSNDLATIAQARSKLAEAAALAKSLTPAK